MARARSIKAEGEELREALHGGVEMRVIGDGITLIAADLGAILERELLVSGIGGSFDRTCIFPNGCPFGLACGVIGCLVELVVGAGVVVFHNRPTMTPRPATNHSPTPPLRITNRSNRLTRSGLVQQVVPYNRYQPLCRRSLFVVSWLHPRFIAGTRW